MTRPSLNDIRAAQVRIAGEVLRTPCEYGRTLSEITGAEVFVKFENMQFTASFKERGALNRLLNLTEAERRAGVIAMSAGNHAQAVAYHAQRLGIPATIVMPAATPYVKVSQTEGHGADVILTGDTLEETAGHAQALREEQGLTFVHPYDDAEIVAGQGTVAVEMLEDFPDLDVLLVPVGGGGLISGCAIAAKGMKPDVRIVGVETELYPSAYQSLHGEPIACGGQTIAEGIAVKNPGRLTLAVIRDLVDDMLVVPEADIERAVDLYSSVEKTVAEGAGATSLAALLTFGERFRGQRVGLVLSGGNIDSRLLASILMRALVRQGRITRLRIDIDDRPGVLASIAGVIAAGGGNILDVHHQRMLLNVPAKQADLEIILETRDRSHVATILTRLREAGYQVRELLDLSSS